VRKQRGNTGTRAQKFAEVGKGGEKRVSRNEKGGATSTEGREIDRVGKEENTEKRPRKGTREFLSLEKKRSKGELPLFGKRMKNPPPNRSGGLQKKGRRHMGIRGAILKSFGRRSDHPSKKKKGKETIEQGEGNGRMAEKNKERVAAAET